jgi:hypothetical protein
MDPITLSAAAVIATQILVKIGEGSLARFGEMIADQSASQGASLFQLIRRKRPALAAEIEQLQALPAANLGEAQLESVSQQIAAIAQEEPEVATTVEAIATTVVRQVLASDLDVGQDLTISNAAQKSKEQAIQELATRIKVAGDLTLKNLSQISEAPSSQTAVSHISTKGSLVIDGLNQTQG